MIVWIDQNNLNKFLIYMLILLKIREVQFPLLSFSVNQTAPNVAVLRDKSLIFFKITTKISFQLLSVN